MVYERYGPAREVLEQRDLDVPDVGRDGVLVRVRAAAINPADWHLMNGVPYLMRVQAGLRLRQPRGLGSDLAGRVEAVGPDVVRFRPGEEVYGSAQEPSTDAGCGSVAELVRVRESSLVPRPPHVSPEEAAGIPLAATTALRGLRDVADVQPGQHVLINGASGGVGHFMVQIAKVLGAEVTGVCSAANVELVRSLGADHVIDYTVEDPRRGGPRYDVIIDNVGNHSPASWRPALRPEGTYVASFGRKQNRWAGPFGAMIGMFVLDRFVSQRLTFLPPVQTEEQLATVAELVESGRLRTVVDRTYPLVEAVEAMDHLATERARGKVVIAVEGD